MAIYLSMAALIKRGDTCITSFPGYQIVDDMVKHLGGKVAHVAVDAEGLLTSEVEKLCKERDQIAPCHPHHHYPTTVTLSPTRRIELLKLASKHNFFILEDDYAYDFQYANNPVLPLASLNCMTRVIYIGSFSKCISPVCENSATLLPVRK